MCGIVGYVGGQRAADILLNGLARVEYRGYDSAGIATLSSSPDGRLETNMRRSVGKLENLRALVGSFPAPGHMGIGHTRWATHGKPTERNAHPHQSGTITVVHNGIIENYYELRKKLERMGRLFASETDTEIVAHLVDIARNKERLPFQQAVLSAARKLKGAFALAIIDESSPDEIICVKQACPLIIGIGNGENFIASDFTPAISYTNRFIILEDGDVAEVDKDSIHLFSLDGKNIERKETTIDWSVGVAEKEGHKHFMHKEICDQPRALIDTLRGRYKPEDQHFELDEVNTDVLKEIDRVSIVACGTSYYAALVGKYVIEEIARIPVDVDLASEFRYRDVLLSPKTLVLGISQSGETADTLAALRFASEKGAPLLAICNVIGSAVTRLCKSTGGTLYTRAGPEISVASTKAFVSQLMALNILALHLADERHTLEPEKIQEYVDDLNGVGACVEQQLDSEVQLRHIAQESVNAQSLLFLGRGVGFPIALEGALKMKEISYVHAEGFAAGELKHGAIALIDPQVTSIAVALAGPHFEKIVSNMQEVKSRGGRVIAVTNQPCTELDDICDHVVVIPRSTPFTSPILAAVPLQLLAYHMADLRGLDVDQPRNLAKSVTVE